MVAVSVVVLVVVAVIVVDVAVVVVVVVVVVVPTALTTAYYDPSQLGNHEDSCLVSIVNLIKVTRWW